MQVTANSDVAIVVVGIGREDVREGWDRLDLDLNDADEALINAVAAVNPHTVVLLTIGPDISRSCGKAVGELKFAHQEGIDQCCTNRPGSAGIDITWEGLFNVHEHH